MLPLIFLVTHFSNCRVNLQNLAFLLADWKVHVMCDGTTSQELTLKGMALVLLSWSVLECADSYGNAYVNPFFCTHGRILPANVCAIQPNIVLIYKRGSTPCDACFYMKIQGPFTATAVKFSKLGLPCPSVCPLRPFCYADIDHESLSSTTYNHDLLF